MEPPKVWPWQVAAAPPGSKQQPRRRIPYQHSTTTTLVSNLCSTSQLLQTLSTDTSEHTLRATMSLNPRTPGANHTHSTSRLSTVPTSASKTRQLSHLHAQLAQLTANMSDTENLLRMTAVQAEGMRGLGGYAGGMWVTTKSLEEEHTGILE